MRPKFFFTGLILSTICSISIFPQLNNPSNGKVPDQQLKPVVPFIKSAALGEDLAYGYETISENFISMPIPAGTPFNVISNWQAPNFASSMVRGGNGSYYLLDYFTPTLYQVDVISGVVVLIGNISGMPNETGNGIAYDATTGKYYLAGGTFGVTNNLYELDINSLTATLIGSFANPTGGMIDISIDANTGIGYGYDIIDDQAYTFDPATGASSVLGSIGFDANFGQGMDIDQVTGTIYLSSFNNGTFSGQLRTMDPLNGSTTLIVDWGFAQVAPFAINNEYGDPVGPGQATNPNPPSAAFDVSLSLQELQWENPIGAISVEIYFGEDPGNLDLIYSGSIINSISVAGLLSYSTTYYWKVDEIDSTGTSYGYFWFFTIENDPYSPILFEDDFESGSSNWIITNDGGTCVWEIIDGNSRPYTLPSTSNGYVFAADADLCGSGQSTLTTAIIDHPINATNFMDVWIEWDNDWQAIDNQDFAYVDVSTDNGATWQNVVTFDVVDVRNTHEFYSISSLVGNSQFLLRLVSVQPGWDWWWAIDNFKVMGFDYGYHPPAAPSNLTAISIVQGEVELNWQDNSDDESGFFVYRK
jgi:hypothetical protein